MCEGRRLEFAWPWQLQSNRRTMALSCLHVFNLRQGRLLSSPRGPQLLVELTFDAAHSRWHKLAGDGAGRKQGPSPRSQPLGVVESACQILR